MTDKEFLVMLEKVMERAVTQLEDSPKSFYSWAKEQLEEMKKHNRKEGNKNADNV